MMVAEGSMNTTLVPLSVDDRNRQPLTSASALPWLKSSTNSSLAPDGPRNRYSLMTTRGTPAPVCAPTCSWNGDRTAPSNPANTKDQTRALMIVLDRKSVV